MSETEQERLERIRADNVETLRRAGHLLIANEESAIKILCEVCNSPNEAFARAGVNMAIRLLGEMAREIRTADRFQEFKPPLNG